MSLTVMIHDGARCSLNAEEKSIDSLFAQDGGVNTQDVTFFSPGTETIYGYRL